MQGGKPRSFPYRSTERKEPESRHPSTTRTIEVPLLSTVRNTRSGLHRDQDLLLKEFKKGAVKPSQKYVRIRYSPKCTVYDTVKSNTGGSSGKKKNQGKVTKPTTKKTTRPVKNAAKTGKKSNNPTDKKKTVRKSTKGGPATALANQSSVSTMPPPPPPPPPSINSLYPSEIPGARNCHIRKEDHGARTGDAVSNLDGGRPATPYPLNPPLPSSGSGAWPPQQGTSGPHTPDEGEPTFIRTIRAPYETAVADHIRRVREHRLQNAALAAAGAQPSGAPINQSAVRDPSVEIVDPPPSKNGPPQGIRQKQTPHGKGATKTTVTATTTVVDLDEITTDEEHSFSSSADSNVDLYEIPQYQGHSSSE